MRSLALLRAGLLCLLCSASEAEKKCANGLCAEEDATSLLMTNVQLHRKSNASSQIEESEVEYTGKCKKADIPCRIKESTEPANYLLTLKLEGGQLSPPSRIKLSTKVFCNVILRDGAAVKQGMNMK
jgi:hypothetical protein